MLKKIDHHFEKMIVSLFMLTMIILIFIQVVSRYVFGDSITWTEEASRYLFIWLIFLTIGVGFKENKHISIDIIIDLFPVFIQKVLKQMTYLLVFALSVLFTYQGFVLVGQMFEFGQTSANLELPMWLVYSSLPVGFLLTSIRLINVSISLWSHKRGEQG